MIRPALLIAAASAAFAASPASARPMTATDMHLMHRVGAPEVSSDGRYALFTISDTDLARNKRNNRLYLLDLTRAGSAPQPVKGAEQGHDAVFGPDGALWFLMAAGDHDQLFRMAVGGPPGQASSFKGDIGGGQLPAPGRSGGPPGAPRPVCCASPLLAPLP